MTDAASTERAAAEMAYCERVLAKSGTSILGRVLPRDGLVEWAHYPEGDVFDPEHGASWFYHCHSDSAEKGEHGHFHCFLRPDGAASAARHLVAVGVDANSLPTRLFTVNRWVVGGAWHPAAETVPLLERFNVELAKPDYLVNRWLTALLARYDAEIRCLIDERDKCIDSLGGPSEALFEDRSLELLSSLQLS